MQPVFARHESFYPRFGWLWKAVNLTQTAPDLFLRPDATVELGVGKNMVRAIRYWGIATRAVSEHPDLLQALRGDRWVRRARARLHELHHLVAELGIVAAPCNEAVIARLVRSSESEQFNDVGSAARALATRSAVTHGFLPVPETRRTFQPKRLRAPFFAGAAEPFGLTAR